jgi:hypothetical protein
VKPDLGSLFDELGSILQWAHHDGAFDSAREIWDQDIPELKTLWGHLTHPVNVESLRVAQGTAGNADWNRLITEAYRQALARSADRGGK